MWKYVTKAVKDALEKGNGILYCRSVNAQDYELNCNNPFRGPLQIDIVEDSNESKDGCKDKIKSNQYLASHIFQALTCSTAMALGWTATHLFYIRNKKNLTKEKGQNKQKPFLILSHIVFAQPTIIRSISIKPQPIEESTETSKIGDAVKELASVTGSLENRIGAAYIQQSQPDVGIEHFEAGALYQNPSAAFNLGLCYELGIGTKQNYRKAADCYQIAAELGHTKAMYNLAVYHINGYGGLSMDFNQARLLFKEAAKRGHKESIEALKIESNDIFN